MALLQLPQTAGCVVCGPFNPHGLHLSLFVDEQSGIVHSRFTPEPSHIGFEGIVHGGLLSAVLDEVMVWAATWAGRRFCVCGELSVRFRQSASIGEPLDVQARVISNRPRLILTTAEIRADGGALIATAEAKYVPVPPQRNVEFLRTLIDQQVTGSTAQALWAGAKDAK